MKLAEALILRADCQKRMEQLRDRLTISAKIQEGEEPPENPQALISEVDGGVQELEDLIKKINKTNSLTTLEDGVSLSDALAKRDALALKRGIYKSLVDESAVRQDRYSRSEVKFFSTINIGEVQTLMDRMSRQYRELDTKIQQANWNTELID
ncbi:MULTISPECIES: DIP1984 family protein [unclassified Microcoleus]|uniref:DIP1984 family protein n=1 Tax=unclassified Microcoleus TaxID=2642155 RepID=UPI002FCEC535